MNDPILHNALPDGQVERAAARLPSMRPVEGPWLFCDEVYAAQMAERRRLVAAQPDDVIAQLSEGLPAARAFLTAVVNDLPDGFQRNGDLVHCPDGAEVKLDWESPLRSVGQMLQQDVCILEKREAEHVLTGAVLCFPASWTLAQKIGQPLTRIHVPVGEYDDTIARRVQRFFDGVQRGKPMWRANLLRYEDPALFHPRPEHDPRPNGSPASPYLRSERQTVVRLNHPGAVAFVIHTMVMKAPSERDDNNRDAQQAE
ncbi:MAG: DUF3445 domain-containing protein [Pseudomonadota bacterium]